ncbi:MAG: ribosome biogenesis GTP-binding protein YihA/YsxC [Myxococcota bacterium]|jgi:GTP-binding protein|nr:ribosome biogenesis GTP-binding protein YsxC [Myxococcota bacterium]MBP8970265.1 ribosome biogenesis GTP-binding protein YsxC [Myxococcota bacterium]HHW96054.1 ribosome biogenesis GTP-binding protein YsxC [Oligoflexales bacterium]HQC43622.1 ribosome biogenesis GTP-binding protein YihA/YsxC [Myxococcota bacterium]HQL56483.1 ribosome biogenesis GTP-binding protein YihA/YsxC [Myxococcota bacterium]
MLRRPFVSWIGAATSLNRVPEGSVPEVAFLGRSNVGKSSLINALAGSAVARVSSSPGRTRAIHFMDVAFDGAKNPVELRLVDLPGYGYAKVSRAEANEWPKFINPYLTDRPQLVLALVLVDSGIGPQPKDVQMIDWLKNVQRSVQTPLNFMVVATKADRRSSKVLSASLSQMKEVFGVQPMPVSAKTGAQIPELWFKIRRACGVK